MTLTEMRRFLEEGDIQLTKSLGQNFLHDSNQLRRIAAAGELAPTDKVLEIGPGLGPLTELLLAGAAEVLAIELDARLVGYLKQRWPAEPRLRLVHGDALDYLRSKPRDWGDWKLVANLPYSVASPILVDLAEAQRPPERLVATLQIEVAQRLMARADDEDYGVLTLLVQLQYEPRGWFRIPPGCFFPAPNVDSACVTLVRRAQPLLDPAGALRFKRLVKRAFSQRRKMMLKLLKADWPLDRLQAAFGQVGLDPSIRAEKVSLGQFVELARLLAPLPSPFSLGGGESQGEVSPNDSPRLESLNHPSPGLRPPSPHPMGRGQGEGTSGGRKVRGEGDSAGSNAPISHHERRDL